MSYKTHGYSGKIYLSVILVTVNLSIQHTSFLCIWETITNRFVRFVTVGALEYQQNYYSDITAWKKTTLITYKL